MRQDKPTRNSGNRKAKANRRTGKKSGSKYKNIKVIIDGIKFDSKKEGKYYGSLKLQKKANLIKDFELQPRFDFKIDGKLMFYYKADFKVFNLDGSVEIIDVKSAITRKNSTYRLKKKIIEKVYDIEIIEK